MHEPCNRIAVLTRQLTLGSHSPRLPLDTYGLHMFLSHGNEELRREIQEFLQVRRTEWPSSKFVFQLSAYEAGDGCC
eukprot:scaffold173380_cov13-Tisochrysis_lutea.AAC.1